MVKAKANKPVPSVAKKVKITSGSSTKTRQKAEGHPAVPAAANPGNPQAKLATQPAASSVEAAQAIQSLGPVKSQSGIDLTEKVKELVRLAQEQGYLTYNDINDALPG